MSESKETKGKSETARDFNRDRQAIIRDARDGKLNTDDDGKIIVDRLYAIRKEQYRLMDEQKELMPPK